MIIESGLFKAHTIDVPEDVVDSEGKVLLRMADLSYVLVQRDNDDPFAVSFWDGLLLSKTPDQGWVVKILLPLNAASGNYSFEGSFYYLDSGNDAFNVAGSFFVDDTIKDDCGCLLFGQQPADHIVGDEEAADNVTPLDLLSSSNYTSKNIRNERYDICKGCDSLFKPTRTCRECGCFMGLKTWLKDASCPLGKW